MAPDSQCLWTPPVNVCFTELSQGKRKSTSPCEHPSREMSRQDHFPGQAFLRRGLWVPAGRLWLCGVCTESPSLTQTWAKDLHGGPEGPESFPGPEAGGPAASSLGRCQDSDGARLTPPPLSPRASCAPTACPASLASSSGTLRKDLQSSPGCFSAVTSSPDSKDAETSWTAQDRPVPSQENLHPPSLSPDGERF